MEQISEHLYMDIEFLFLQYTIHSPVKKNTNQLYVLQSHFFNVFSHQYSIDILRVSIHPLSPQNRQVIVKANSLQKLLLSNECMLPQWILTSVYAVLYCSWKEPMIKQGKKRNFFFFFIYQTLLSKVTYSAFSLHICIVSMCVPWGSNTTYALVKAML